MSTAVKLMHSWTAGCHVAQQLTRYIGVNAVKIDRINDIHVQDVIKRHCNYIIIVEQHSLPKRE